VAERKATPAESSSSRIWASPRTARQTVDVVDQQQVVATGLGRMVQRPNGAYAYGGSVPEALDLLTWLREQCGDFIFLPAGVYVEQGDHDWPLVAHDPADLTVKLDEAGHLVSLPKESAALANVIEVALVDFLLDRLSMVPGASGRHGEERSYPDLEISGEAFGGTFHAVDIKMARLNKRGLQTQSRCTLYTGNTYFKWPTIRWPGMFRPFDDYASHLDIIGVYRLDVSYRGRVRDLELFVHEPWRIASKERSSTTREYIGAVTQLAALRAGQGEFETDAAFCKYWRAFPFRVPKAVERQLQKALREQSHGDAVHDECHRAAVASNVCSIYGPRFLRTNLAGSTG